MPRLKMAPIIVGQFNALNDRAYLLTMDNGRVALADLNHPSTGPAFYATASEVAIRIFVNVSSIN